MARKGDRAGLEPRAIRMYTDGNSIAEIARQLGISETSLTRWKNESKKPTVKLDEWDRAREQKRGNIQRLRDLFEDQLGYLEELHASERSAPMMDCLSKMGSLLERWDKIEKARAVADQVMNQVKQAGLTDATADDIRARILGIGQ